MKHFVFIAQLLMVFVVFSCSGKKEGVADKPSVADDISIINESQDVESLLLETVENDGVINEIELMKVHQGKWLLLTNDFTVDESGSFIEIFPNNGIWEFKSNYYNSISKGMVVITEYGTLCLMKGNDLTPYNIVGKPFEKNGKMVILIDSEGPLGYFQRE